MFQSLPCVDDNMCVCVCVRVRNFVVYGNRSIAKKMFYCLMFLFIYVEEITIVFALANEDELAFDI